MPKNFTIIIIGIVLVIILGFLAWNTREKDVSEGIISHEQAFSRDGLKTDTSIASIALEKVLSGGPGKDGIPAITNPKFVSAEQAKRFLTDDISGILLVRGETAKFYPYNILVWHEVVNDTIEGEAVVVTFCPLCASAIVFDANVDGKKETFGVSGKIYESNLLMYDHATESLWSQIIGEAVVGKKTGKKLTHIPFQLVSFGEIRGRFPQAEILSTDTGFSRDYTFYPYGDYNKNDDIYFPISITDTRLPLKEPMYIVDVLGSSIAFKFLDLKENVTARVRVGTEEITAESKSGDVVVKRADGTVIPGYYALWFSWAIHHQKDGIVWTKK
ncbi:MAG: DUF3179 domain-containing protein [Candidatus Liptonbacteria bacterium]|nr:DUF3179 domain-containing protein [Candidatus Liptonbacteria bacterium]